MPFPWAPIAIVGAFVGGVAATPAAPVQAMSMNGGQEKGSPSKVVQVDPDLVVTAESTSFDPLTTTYTFRRGVVATYGPTVIHAEMLVVHAAVGDSRAEAAGSVLLEDPAGTMMADDLKFTWKQGAQAATAENAMIHIGDAMLRARHVELKAGQWELYDVRGTPCRESPPLFQIRSRRLTIFPGQSASLERPTLYIFGERIVTVPNQAFNLSPSSEGFQYPTPSYRNGSGIGVNFQSGFLLTPQTNLNVNYSAFPDARPGYGTTLTQTFVPPSKTSSILTPKSELSERFSFGYFENIHVLNPEQEERYLRAPRDSVAVDSVWNAGVSDRGIGLPYSKPIEGIYELGGPAGGLGFLGQIRAQSIEQNGGPVHSRVILAGSTEIPPIVLAPRLRAIARADTNLFVGDDYGWVRGIAGLVYRPISPLTVAAAGFSSGASGTNRFYIDPLYARQGYVFRADLNLGPTQMSYMSKWDQTLGWFDREYCITQVAGCLEPFLISRTHPQSYNLGVMIRLDSFYNAIRDRHFDRNLPGRTVLVSPAP